MQLSRDGEEPVAQFLPTRHRHTTCNLISLTNGGAIQGASLLATHIDLLVRFRPRPRTPKHVLPPRHLQTLTSPVSAQTVSRIAGVSRTRSAPLSAGSASPPES